MSQVGQVDSEVHAIKGPTFAFSAVVTEIVSSAHKRVAGGRADPPVRLGETTA